MASSNKKSSKKEDFAFTYQAQKLGLTEALLELQVPLVLRRGWLSKNTITNFVASKDMLAMVLFCCVFTSFLQVYFAIIKSTFYRLIKGQQYLKKMYEINCDD